MTPQKALTNAVNKAIANGALIITEQRPAGAMYDPRPAPYRWQPTEHELLKAEEERSGNRAGSAANLDIYGRVRVEFMERYQHDAESVATVTHAGALYLIYRTATTEEFAARNHDATSRETVAKMRAANIIAQSQVYEPGTVYRYNPIINHHQDGTTSTHSAGEPAPPEIAAARRQADAHRAADIAAQVAKMTPDQRAERYNRIHRRSRLTWEEIAAINNMSADELEEELKEFAPADQESPQP